MKKFILLLLLFSNKIEAQSVAGMGLNSSLPSTCSMGTSTYLTTGTVGLYICTATNTWTLLSTPSNILPAGTIILKNSGTCPTYWSEVTALNGVMLRGTLAANGNVGTSGGNDTITPTINSLAAAAQTFTGNSVTSSAVSAGTPSGSNGTVSFTPTGTNSSLTFTGSAWSAPALSWPVGVPTNSNESSHTHSVIAAGANGTVSITPLGTVSAPVFTGSALAAHAHELPWQIPSTTTIRQIAIATFGTGTSRAATAVSAAGTANTTSAAVALSESKSAGTPAGTNSAPTFTGSSTTVGAETFTGSAVTSGAGSSHTHTISWPVGVPTIAAYTPAGSINTPTFTGNSGTVAAETFIGNVLGTHTHTTTATGTNGTSSVTGSLNSFDNRPAYTNVIFCSKD